MTNGRSKPKETKKASAAKATEAAETPVLHQNDWNLISIINSKDWTSISEAVKLSKLNRDAVLRSVFTLKEINAAEVKEQTNNTYSLTEEGQRFLKEGYPEQKVAEAAEKGTAIDKLTDEQRRIGVPWALKNGWIEVQLGKLKRKQKPEGYALQDGLKLINEGKVPDKKILDILVSRKNAEMKASKAYEVRLTAKGEKLKGKVKEQPKESVSELTSEMITSGKWKTASLRRYNVEAEVEAPASGSQHPLTAYIEKVRDIFVALGFEEMEGQEVESSFWNFDALFTPQDHPARELHDTFYLKQPKYVSFPNDVAEKVKQVQESSWKYTWDPSVAEQAILRTHTTPVSARTLVEIAKGKKKPGKYFVIGRIYRNEATDYSHLAEFHQIEGIVVWKNANFRHLLGLLEEFYKRLGFRKVRFRPHYFPYTEPSLEIDVYLEDRKKWLELGGAGIFRPEVTKPLWGDYPVLAWGLGLERALMIQMGEKYLAKFYQNDLHWLKDNAVLRLKQ